ncbi:transposase family protein [Streptomyces sp. Li-HN-5-13]|nr:transposase family protein [Streptomyces sp. Li-HN-5-13]
MIKKRWARAALSHPAFTGISRTHLDGLAEELAPRWQARRESALRERRHGARRRQVGAGPKCELVFADRLLATLIHLRTGLTHQALAVIYEVGSSTIGRAISEIRRGGPKDHRRLTLEELRDLLIDALQLHRAVKGAATHFLPGEPQTGEGVLRIISLTEFGQLIDMDAYGATSRPGRNEIPLHYRLPLQPPQQLPLQFGTSAPSPEARLAVELIKRSLRWTGRQSHAPALNQLLRTAPR